MDKLALDVARGFAAFFAVFGIIALFLFAVFSFLGLALFAIIDAVFAVLLLGTALAILILVSRLQKMSKG